MEVRAVNGQLLRLLVTDDLEVVVVDAVVERGGKRCTHGHLLGILGVVFDEEVRRQHHVGRFVEDFDVLRWRHLSLRFFDGDQGAANLLRVGGKAG